MTAQQFEYLCIHACSLAELALRQAAEAALAGMEASPPAAPLGKAMRAHPLASLDLDALDFAALDGLDLGGDGGAALPDDALADAEVPAAAGLVELAPATELTAYLASAYAAAPRVRARLLAGQGRVDAGQLDAWLAALPSALPALTERLDACALADWLAFYQHGPAALTDLVCELRRIDLRA